METLFASVILAPPVAAHSTSTELLRENESVITETSCDGTSVGFYYFDTAARTVTRTEFWTIVKRQSPLYHKAELAYKGDEGDVFGDLDVSL